MSIVPTGYPDFSRRISHSDQLLFEDTIGPGVGRNATDAFPVAGVPAIGLRMGGDTDHMRLDVDWYMDAAFATFLVTQEFHVRSTGEFIGSIPCLGPFVSVAATGSTANAFGALKIWTVGQGGPHDMSAAARQLLTANPVNVGAGAATDIFGTNIWPGISHFSLRTTIATWVASLFSIAYDGTLTGIARWNNTAGQAINQQIATSAQQLQLTFTNTSGAAGDVYAYVNGMTWGPIT